jgi:hypothetical protein
MIPSALNISDNNQNKKASNNRSNSYRSDAKEVMPTTAMMPPTAVTPSTAVHEFTTWRWLQKLAAMVTKFSTM